ncbi:MAG: ABC transporter ATP-binding protein, partial [Myxococcales bacterium]|nr:ABC transporter ATP-binding protein [Myxococcales bacterium]
MALALVRQDDEQLLLLLRTLCKRLSVELSEDLLRAAARDAEQAPAWDEALALALGPLGLRARWVEGTMEEAAAIARYDLPVLTWIEAGISSRWVVLDGRWLGSPSAIDPFHPPPIQLPDRVVWARVEPVLPASPLSPSGGRRTPLRRLFGLLDAERSDLGVVLVFAVATGLLSLATPLTIQVLINWLAFGALVQPIIVLSGALLVCLLLAAGVRVAKRQVVEVLQRRIFVRTVADLSARLARVRLEELDGRSAPELVNRFFDVLTLQKATSTLLLDGVGAALQAAVGLALLAVYHPALLVFDLIVVALAAVVLLPLARGALRTALDESKAKYQVAGWLEEVGRQTLVFKLGGATLAEERADRLVRSWLTARASHFRVFLRQYAGMQLVQVVVGVGLLATSGWLVLEGQLTLGQLVAAEFVVTAALAGLAKFTDKLETVYDLLAGLDKLGSLVDLGRDGTVGAVPRSSGPPTIEALDLHVTAPGAVVLNGASLTVGPGSSVAIVTDDVTDRSLLGEVLAGARPPAGGVLRRDGLPYAAHRPDLLTREALLCRPDGLIAGTIAENVSLGR